VVTNPKNFGFLNNGFVSGGGVNGEVKVKGEVKENGVIT
jgi:hypothetical protein